MPEAAAGQPAAPERREAGLHPPSRPGLPLQGDLCHGEAKNKQTHTNKQIYTQNTVKTCR